MALTITEVSGAGEAVLAGMGIAKVYEVTPDSSWLAVGEVMADLADDFSEIFFASFGGRKAIGGFVCDVIIPDPGTDVSATNVKMTAHYSTDAAGEMTAVPDATDLSVKCAKLRMLVIGKAAD
jgi:hypothetical protein